MLDLIKKLDEFFTEYQDKLENYFYSVTFSNRVIDLQGRFNESIHNFLLDNFKLEEKWINEKGTCHFYEFYKKTDNFHINITLTKNISKEEA